MRSYNCLKREGINTVGDLVQKSESELMDIRNFGQKSIDEVKAQARRARAGPAGGVRRSCRHPRRDLASAPAPRISA